MSKCFIEKREDGSERSIEEFERLSGQGDSQGWGFNREEIHSRKDADAALLDSLG